jgi:hypothetical protein
MHIARSLPLCLLGIWHRSRSYSFETINVSCQAKPRPLFGQFASRVWKGVRVDKSRLHALMWAHIRSVESKLPIIKLTYRYCNFRTDVLWMAVTCIWGIKYRILKLGPPFPFHSVRDLHWQILLEQGRFLIFSFECHSSVDGKHLFTTLFKMYDAPYKMAPSQASVRASLLTRRFWTEFRVKKIVLYLFGHYRVVEWLGGR